MVGSEETGSIQPSPSLDEIRYLRDAKKDSLDKLGSENLAYIYILSHLPGYEDEETINKVDKIIESMRDPVGAKFAFAYTLATTGWDTYSTWGRDYNSSEEENAHKELETSIALWLEEGIKAKPDNQAVQAGICFVAQRIPSDTFLRKSSRELLEEAAGKSLTIGENEFLKQAIQNFVENFGQSFGDSGTESEH